MNEIGRRTKAGGILIFVIIPIILTVYFIGMHLGAFGGASIQLWSTWMDGSITSNSMQQISDVSAS